VQLDAIFRDKEYWSKTIFSEAVLDFGHVEFQMSLRHPAGNESRQLEI
jgi:hypothetical protein